MSVVAFDSKRTTGFWDKAELDTIVAALSAALVPGGGRTWETGMTENGDPQFYLLGPPLDQVCELSVSRIGESYIVEDGAGRLLFEHRSLALVALHARAAAARSAPWGLVVLLWCTVRQIIHDRVEPWLAESEELLVDLAPQLVAFA
jgi:hypothetical protein